MTERIGIAGLAEIAATALTGSATAIAAVADLAQRLSGIDITVVSQLTPEGGYAFRGLESRMPVPVARDDVIPYPTSLCSRIHAGESPATVPDTQLVPALWAQWLRLKGVLGVDWDVRAFCTRDVTLADGTTYGTVCFHHRQPREFSTDEETLLEVLARMLAQEIDRERARAEVEQATHELLEAERLRLDLAEELRHELRAPLQVIDGYGEAMLDGVLDATPEHLELVRGEAARAMRLLDDIIDLTRLETVGAPATAVPVDLAAVVRSMRDRLAPLAEAAGVTLRGPASGGPVVVLGDERRLEQLVVNLLRNAIRAASGSGGSVSVEVADVGDEAVLTVADDGPGIPADEAPRVFERFYRGSSERDARTGSGLGLTIAHRIVTASGGTIEAGRAPGGGALLTARLPVGEEGASDLQAGVEP